MSKKVTLTAAASLVALGGAASAYGRHQVIDLGNWVVDSHDVGIVLGPSIDFTVDSGFIVWEIEFDFVNQFDDSSWASDLEFKLTNPIGETWVIGQEAFDGGDPFGPEDEIWNFDGANGQPTGHYSHTSAGLTENPIPGTWNVMLAESWDGGVEYNNITLTLVPVPGSLPLLAAGGLLAVPRRRRREE